MLNLNYELFHFLSKHVHLKNLLGRLFHIFYTQCNLPREGRKQFDLLYNHPMEPFQERHRDRHEHIVYNQYKYRKLLRYVT
jgi:hypothetical protein